MDQQNNLPVLAKEVWRLVRVLYSLLRKNIFKSKLLLDLTKMMKRRKINGGKSLLNLTSHHHHHHNNNCATNFATPPPAGEYEFSCTNSPAAVTNNNPIFSLLTSYSKHHSSINKHTDDLDMMAVNAALMKMIHSEMASPVALPGFGRSPLVRQLRVTDSPFPLSNNVDAEEDSHVDEAVEQFISCFYNDLRRQY